MWSSNTRPPASEQRCLRQSACGHTKGTAELETLPHLAKATGMQAPALIIIGEGVRLRREGEWFETCTQRASGTALSL
jgi:siroheme synthase